ncbi:hypothetical protein Droror1_Dr00003217, partial [Drosera rotundifolia]
PTLFISNLSAATFFHLRPPNLHSTTTPPSPTASSSTVAPSSLRRRLPSCLLPCAAELRNLPHTGRTPSMKDRRAPGGIDLLQMPSS